jgi:hypothetical protein
MSLTIFLPSLSSLVRNVLLVKKKQKVKLIRKSHMLQVLG